MGFNDFYKEDMINLQILNEMADKNTGKIQEADELAAEIEDTGIQKKVNKFEIFKALSGFGRGLTKKQTIESIKLAAKGLTSLATLTAFFGKGGSGKPGGGIFTSIIRYTSPIVRQVTPSKELIKEIQDIVKKNNYEHRPANIIGLQRFKQKIQAFLKENPIPDKDILEDLKKLVNDIPKAFHFLDKHYEQNPQPLQDKVLKNGKTKPPTQREQLAWDKKSIAINKEWEKKFIEFLNNENFDIEVREIMAELFIYYNVKLKPNKDEIKFDFDKFSKTFLSQEAIEMGVTLIKMMKNFVLTLIGVYLLKIIKNIASK